MIHPPKATSSPSPLAREEAGTLLRERRKALKLTQAQVVERTSVPTTQYLGNLESGRISVAKSRHLPTLVRALDLTSAEIAAITGIQEASQSDHVLDVPILSTPDLFGIDWNKSRWFRLSSDPDTVIQLDPADTAPQKGQWYAVTAPCHAPVHAYRAHCIEFGEQTLLVIENTAYEVDTIVKSGGQILGRLQRTYFMEVQEQPIWGTSQDQEVITYEDA